MDKKNSAINNRMAREKKTLRLMIGIFCRKNHNTNDALCVECADLLAYAIRQLDRCPFGLAKPACSRCLIHCYQPEYRSRIKTVMRYSGSRMLFYHPVFLISHYLEILKPSNKNEKK